MKALIALFVVFPLTAQSAELCATRAEDEGYPNIYPVTLMMGKHEVATLFGGTKTCVALKPPGNTVWIRWHAFDWKRRDHGLHSKLMLRSPYTIAILLNGVRRIDIKVCSHRDQGGAPFWHLDGDYGKPCP